MSSCIRSLYRIGGWTLAVALLSPGVRAQDADALYRNRATLADARQAADLWAASLQHTPGDLDAAWKLARACYWLGGHEDGQSARDRAFERGMRAARQAISAAPDRPEGHFWLAANMGGYAEAHGIRGGLHYRGDIRSELETVLQLDAGYLQGSADRALGRWYFKVPGLFGGSNRKSELHLRKALTYNPRSIITHLFLAETLDAEGQSAAALAELARVAELPVDPDWAPEDEEFKARARALAASWK